LVAASVRLSFAAISEGVALDLDFNPRRGLAKGVRDLAQRFDAVALFRSERVICDRIDL
jgi:hypothetical protein